MEQKRILVVGGTGNCGLAVVKSLEKKGSLITVACREPEKCKELLNCKNIKLVKIDLNNQSTWDKAFENVDRVFFMALPLDPEPEKYAAPFLEKCKFFKIQKLIFVSVLNVERFPLAKVENLIKSSGINHIILRAPFFMENITNGWMKDEIFKHNSLSAPAGDHATVWISTRDIGECAATLFFDNKFINQTIDLTGPAPLNFNQICDLLSKYLGKSIKYNNLRIEDYNKNLLNSGMKDPSIRYMDDLFKAVSDDKTNKVSMGVQQILGRAPLSFETVIKESLMKSPMPGM
eukprot:gene6160-7673_t